MTAKIDELLQRIDELSHKKNSRNSSSPPSSDGYAKPAPKSQCKTTGAKSGGQAGRKGSSMKLMNEPDEVKEHYPEACSGCPNRGICYACIAERRYETDMIVESRPIEHRQMVCCCPMAESKAFIGKFPKNITGTKQYGNNLKAFAAALSSVGMVGIDKLLTGVFDISVSTGSIQNWLRNYKEDILRFATDWTVSFTNNSMNNIQLKGFPKKPSLFCRRSRPCFLVVFHNKEFKGFL